MKLLLFVEGESEKALPAFFKLWLDPRLRQPVGISTIRFKGWRDYYDKIARKVELSFKTQELVGAIGLLDLYGPDFYPKGATTAAERYSWAKKHLEERVGHPRFRQHFAVHELEAWILAAPEILPREIQASLPGRVIHPEDVNFDEPPAKLISRLYREKLRKAFKKRTDVADLFRVLPPEQALQKCPHLKLLLNDMLALAQSGT